MKTTTKILSLAAVALLAFVPASRAQGDDNAPPPPNHEGGGARMKHMREHRMKQLDEKLNLTADQKTQITAIWDKADEQARALRKDSTLSREDRRTKLHDLMAATHQQVRAVLTPEQQKIFDTLPPEGPRGGPPPHEGDLPPPPPDAKSE